MSSFHQFIQRALKSPVTIEQRGNSSFILPEEYQHLCKIFRILFGKIQNSSREGTVLTEFRVSFLRFQSSKNIKVKTCSEHHKESTQLKCFIPKTCPKVFQEFPKICKIARSASLMKSIFDKIADMQYLY